MSIVDDIRIKQVFDPKGAKGGYRFEILPDEDMEATDPPVAPDEPSLDDGITELKGDELGQFLLGVGHPLGIFDDSYDSEGNLIQCKEAWKRLLDLDEGETIVAKLDAPGGFNASMTENEFEYFLTCKWAWT